MTDKVKFSVAIRSDAYKNLINNTLGDKEVARRFIADISSVVSSNPALQKCDAGSIISAGLMAQSLKLPLAQSLGQCYIIPYGDKATFQIGYKGLRQLAIRSGQFMKLDCKAVYEGQYLGKDKYGDANIDLSVEPKSEEPIGYYAYFILNNGYEQHLYWTIDQCKKHAKKYSKAYGTGKSTDNWTNMFDLMASKTVLKQLLTKYAPMSIDMQTATTYDQAVIKEDGKYDYVDSPDNEDENSSSSSVNNSLIEEKTLQNPNEIVDL